MCTGLGTLMAVRGRQSDSAFKQEIVRTVFIFIFQSIFTYPTIIIGILSKFLSSKIFQKIL